MDASQQVFNILLIEDNMGDALLVQEYLGDIDDFTVTVHHTTTIREALQYLADDRNINVILLDLNLPDSDSLTGLHRVQEREPNLPILVLTGNSDTQLALMAINDGAQDYLIKDEINTGILRQAITYAIERQQFTKRMIDAEKERLKLVREVENQKILQQMLLGIQHEFRTPLTIITSSTSLWAKRNPSDVADKYQARISKSSNDLVQLINYMGRIAEISLSSTNQKETSTSIASVISNTSSMFGDDAQRLLVHGDIDQTVTITPEALSEVFYQLISNSIMYSDSCPIRISARQVDNNIEIRIQDEGIGIPADHLDKVFMPFYKVSSARSHNQGEGAGMGLTLVQTIVQSHGGHIEIDSTENIGTTVTIRLPKSDA